MLHRRWLGLLVGAEQQEVHWSWKTQLWVIKPKIVSIPDHLLFHVELAMGGHAWGCSFL